RNRAVQLSLRHDYPFIGVEPGAELPRAEDGRSEQGVSGLGVVPLVLPLRFEVFEVWVLRDRSIECQRAADILELTNDGRNHFVPLANRGSQFLRIAILPVITFVVNLHLDAAVLANGIEKRDHAEVAADEVRDAANRWVAGILRLAERPPAPAI